MIREINGDEKKNVERVAVCITAQGNSRRLIAKGAALADEVDGELHILHVQQGNNIFHNADTPKLLEELFNYGSQLGGMIHFHCEDDVAQFLGRFAKEQQITQMVLGQPPMTEANDADQLLHKLKEIVRFIPPQVDLVVVPRNDALPNVILRRKNGEK